RELPSHIRRDAIGGGLGLVGVRRGRTGHGSKGRDELLRHGAGHIDIRPVVDGVDLRAGVEAMLEVVTPGVLHAVQATEVVIEEPLDSRLVGDHPDARRHLERLLALLLARLQTGVVGGRDTQTDAWLNPEGGLLWRVRLSPGRAQYGDRGTATPAVP